MDHAGLNELVRRVTSSGGNSDFTCDYRTFGLPIVSSVTWVIVDLYEGVSGVGLFGAICGLPTLYDYWLQHKQAVAEQETQRKRTEAALQRDFSEVVQFSLCMMADPKGLANVAKGDPKREFSYTTLFEMKVEDLVKVSAAAAALSPPALSLPVPTRRRC